MRKIDYDVVRAAGNFRGEIPACRGRLFHAIRPGRITAVCGKQPQGKVGRWMFEDKSKVTCKKCLMRLKEMQERKGYVKCT